MKYIRTEKGHIYEYVEQRIHQNQYLKFGQYRHNINSEYEQIIAQADTIEELCDGFYVDNKRDFLTSRVFQTFSELKYEFEYYKAKNKKATFYGFIKTDKGLIYVAKMNDKVELELI